MNVRLIDEIASNQERQCLDLSTDDEDEDNEAAYGADPFDIIARMEEEQGGPLNRQ